MDPTPDPQQMPVKQIIYPNVAINVTPLPDGNVQLAILAPGEVLVFPMSREYAANLGRSLTAPHIERV